MKGETLYLLVLSCSLLLLFSCAKEGIEVIDGPVDVLFPDSQAIINSSLHGRIVDESNMPIVGAEVFCHTCLIASSTTTDSSGNFLFTQIENKGSSAYLSVEYPNKYKAFRRFGISENVYNYTVIQLNNKEFTGSLNTDSEGTIEHNSGMSITLPVGGIIDENGQSYSGDYRVLIEKINPTATNYNQNIIGDISGVDNSGSVKVLNSIEMLVIKLQDQTGKPLNLQEGHTATIKFPVPQNSALAAMPLWNYDEKLGFWVEKGRMELADGFYEGTINQVGSWTLSDKAEGVALGGQFLLLIGADRVAPPYYKIDLFNSKIGKISSWLSADGSYLIPNFPQGEIFDLSVTDHCGQEIFVGDFGPYESDQRVGQTIINQTNQISGRVIPIMGNAVNCDLEPVRSGLANISMGGVDYILELQLDGSFLFPASSCTNSIDYMTLYDVDKQTKSLPSVISELDRKFEFEDVLVCDSLYQQYTYMRIPGLYSSLTTSGFSKDEQSEFTEGIESEDYRLLWNKDYVPNGITTGLGKEGILFKSHVFPDGEWISTENVDFLIEQFQDGAAEAKGYYNGTIEYQGERYNINGSFLVRH